jgi:prepilin-type N-terminal cleavage/methylation domain-containing protein
LPDQIATGRTQAAFTLIEMLAVVAILAVVMTFAIPNIGMLERRRMDGECRQLVALLELARQRAVMTGVKHRLWVDLEDAGYRLEWYVTETHGLDAPPQERPRYDVRGGTQLPLAAPPPVEREYRPIPGNHGNLRFLAEEFIFKGLDTEDGWIDSGEVAIVFDRDGTSSYSELILEGESGDARALEILPLADAVRVHIEES